MGKLYLHIPTGNKAKEDIDVLMAQRGFKNVAIRCKSHNSVARFFTKLFSVLILLVRVHRGDVLLVQYPFKKHYTNICRLTHLRGGKVITLIHDLGCFRRKKLTVEQEIKRLNHTDVLIVHNEAMLQFLQDHNIQRPMITLGIFDYLSDNQPVSTPRHDEGQPWDIVYAGGLAERKNKFLYILDKQLPADCCWHLHIHGRGLDESKAALWQHISPRGFIKSDDFIHQSVGHFGLVWDGSAIDECAGDWGVYLKVNNPHKTSFYLRSGKPVIIWRDAALAPFIEREGVGITVGSLTELHQKLQKLTPADYAAMVERVQHVRQHLAEGYYFDLAYAHAEQQL